MSAEALALIELLEVVNPCLVHDVTNIGEINQLRLILRLSGLSTQLEQTLGRTVSV